MFCFLSKLPVELKGISAKNKWVLIYKPTRIRLIIPEEVVMQPRLTVSVLVLQAEGLMRYLLLWFLLSDDLKGRVRNGWRVYPGTIDFTACFPIRFSS